MAAAAVQFVQGIAAQFASNKYGPCKCAAGIVGSADLLKYGAEGARRHSNAGCVAALRL